MNDANTSAFLELMLSVVTNNTLEIHSSQLVGITRLNKTYLFGYLNYLTLVDLYDSDITVFGRSTFYGCGNLTKVVLPKNLNNGGASLFGACANLQEVYLPDVPFTLGSTGAFPISNEGFKFYVSSEEIKALYTDSNLTNWNTYSADLFEVRARE